MGHVMFTRDGWQVTLCDSMWQVTLHSSEMGFPLRALSPPLDYLLNAKLTLTLTLEPQL